eukprot:3555822-Rhodomonas_salina.1
MMLHERQKKCKHGRAGFRKRSKTWCWSSRPTCWPPLMELCCQTDTHHPSEHTAHTHAPCRPSQHTHTSSNSHLDVGRGAVVDRHARHLVRLDRVVLEGALDIVLQPDAVALVARDDVAVEERVRGPLQPHARALVHRDVVVVVHAARLCSQTTRAPSVPRSEYERHPSTLSPALKHTRRTLQEMSMAYA